MHKRIIFKLILWIFLLISKSVEFEKLSAQCTPPPADLCEDASLFCSLDQMNGYSCQNSSMTPGNCWVGCAGCCPPYPARTWWAFITKGGNATIKFTVGACHSCTNSNYDGGIVWEIWGDCHCNEIIACAPACIGIDPVPGKTLTYNVNLEPCKIYYLSADACCYSMCDFTINTSGGGPPTLSPLGYINNLADDIIAPVCAGGCDYKFFVNPLKGSCPVLDVTYVWTLDGKTVGDNNNEIKLDFPVEGDFKLCVSAYLSYQQRESKCSEQGPKCATVIVRKISDKYGIPRVLCADEAGIQWYTNTIDTTGDYRQRFDLDNCCKYDSVVHFTVLPAHPNPTEIFFITCDNKPFVDVLGVKHDPCQNHQYINLPKSSEKYKCDSAIVLTAVNVSLVSNWSAHCMGAKVELSPSISVFDTCKVGATSKLDYK